MCDVCNVEGLNSFVMNGPKNLELNTNKLFKVYRDEVAKIKLCRVHDVELFLVGEKRFIVDHMDLLRELSLRSRNWDN